VTSAKLSVYDNHTPLNILAEKKTLTYCWVQCHEVQIATEIKFVRYDTKLQAFTMFLPVNIQKQFS